MEVELPTRIIVDVEVNRPSWTGCWLRAEMKGAYNLPEALDQVPHLQREAMSKVRETEEVVGLSVQIMISLPPVARRSA